MSAGPWAIERAIAADRAAYVALRAGLWGEDSAAEHDAAFDALLGDAGSVLFLARAGDGAALGFAEATLRRDHVNGCDGSPVLFLEGIHVVPMWQQRGIARALVAAIAGWGEEHGAQDFGSDAALDDPEALAFHRALGFAETERVVFFRRHLP